MFDINIVNDKFIYPYEKNLNLQNNFIQAEPFPNIVIKNFFEDKFLTSVLNDFPDLEKTNNTQRYNNKNELKFANNNYDQFPKSIKKLFDFLNSKVFLEFLQKITSIEEKLISDPELNGGGLHQIKKGGVLKIHTDFNKHPTKNLDRRVNLLLYLNKDWEDSYGGHLELWDKDMKKCFQKIKPDFNTMVIFNTNDFSNHGHPDSLNCPISLSRKSIATYYFSAGRPKSEINSKLYKNTTYFKNRIGHVNETSQKSEKVKNFLRSFKFYQKLKDIEKKYIRRKKNNK